MCTDGTAHPWGRIEQKRAASKSLISTSEGTVDGENDASVQSVWTGNRTSGSVLHLLWSGAAGRSSACSIFPVERSNIRSGRLARRRYARSLYLARAYLHLVSHRLGSTALSYRSSGLRLLCSLVC